MIFPILGWAAVVALAAATVHGIRHGREHHDYAGYAFACLYACAAVILLALLGAVHTASAAIVAVLLAAVTAGIAVNVSGALGAPVTFFAFAAGAAGFLTKDARALPRRIRDRFAGDEDAPVPAAAAAAPVRAAAVTAPFAPPRIPTPGAVRRPAIRARNAARAAAGPALIAVPAEWGSIVAATADFRAESNIEFAEWLTGQVLGAFGWAEAMVEQHEASLNELGVDPAAIAALEDVATAIVGCAETAAGAVHRFCQHFELPDAFVDAGGKLAHDGNWHQGSPDL